METPNSCLLRREFVFLTIVCNSVGCCKVYRPNDMVAPLCRHVGATWHHLSLVQNMNKNKYTYIMAPYGATVAPCGATHIT
jgi:hypothetical protein